MTPLIPGRAYIVKVLDAAPIQQVEDGKLVKFAAPKGFRFIGEYLGESLHNPTISNDRCHTFWVPEVQRELHVLSAKCKWVSSTEPGAKL